jgi:hypothetical protein
LDGAVDNIVVVEVQLFEKLELAQWIREGF